MGAVSEELKAETRKPAWQGGSLRGKVLALILVLGLVGAVSAAAANWHKLAEIVGVVSPPSSSLVAVKIDLGALQAGQSFGVTRHANLTVNANFTVSKLILAIPSSAGEWNSMAAGFEKLYLKVGIDVSGIILMMPEIPLVVNGSSAINPGGDSAQWKFESQETALSYYSYKNWSPKTVQSGTHTASVYAAGETSNPGQEANLAVALYLEINPAS